jgi:hypothetical protein
MTHIFTLQDCNIRVLFQEHSVHITNDDALWKFLGDHPAEATRQLAEEIFRMYETLYGRAFDVHPDSLIVEIWGHVYCEYFALVFEKLLQLKLVEKITDKLIGYCELIDCGEEDYDSNRLFWDMLAPFAALIAGWLPAHIDQKNLK